VKHIPTKLRHFLFCGFQVCVRETGDYNETWFHYSQQFHVHKLENHRTETSTGIS